MQVKAESDMAGDDTPATSSDSSGLPSNRSGVPALQAHVPGGVDVETLPGEVEPLAMRYLGTPVDEAEALGVARRHARTIGREAPPDALPPAAGKRVLTALKLSPRVMAFVRARAEMEGLTVVDVVRAALDAYAAGAPGSLTSFQPTRASKTR